MFVRGLLVDDQVSSHDALSKIHSLVRLTVLYYRV